MVSGTTDLEYFTSLVAEMRKWQKAYFSAPAKSAEKANLLDECRALERRVDAEINKVREPSLF